MDNVHADFVSDITQLSDDAIREYEERLEFSLMEPMSGALEAVKLLSPYFDYILSTAPWENPSAWTDKAE
jgi:hypothetical protein